MRLHCIKNIRQLIKAGLPLLFLLAAFLGFAEPPQVDEHNEDYAVYSALLMKQIRAEAKIAVIEDQTISNYPGGPQYQKDATSLLARYQQLSTWGNSILQESTAEDYLLKNQISSTIPIELRLQIPYVLLTEQEVKQLFNRDLVQSWKAFYDRFSGSDGKYRLSRVGFSSDLTQALVLVAHGCGPLCGTGYFALLTKGNGVWSIHDTLLIWKS